MKAFIKTGITFLLFSVVSSSVNSQELAYGYYNYIMNRFNMNPAFAGYDGKISATLNTKTYQSGLNDAPRNTFFGFQAPVNEQQSFGGRILSDKRGAYEVTKYDVVYSYKLLINESSDVRFGISAGAIRRMLNVNAINNSELLDQQDPTLSSGYFDETNSVIGIGMLYNYNKIQVGVSSPHLVEGSEDLSEFIVGTLAYEYAIENTKLALTPTLIYQNLPEIDNQYDFLLKAEYAEKVWIQAGYQSTENLNLGLGFDLGPFGVGYSYEMNSSELSNIASGSNEIIITVGFERKKQEDKTLTLLDEYTVKLNKMLADSGSNHNKADVIIEVEKIKCELSLLENESDNKKKSKQINKRLMVIENQIIELEKKYK